MKDKINDVCAKVLKTPIENLTNDTTPENLSTWDSINHLNLIATLEGEFDIDFEPEEIVESRKNYGTLVAMIERKLNE